MVYAISDGTIETDFGSKISQLLVNKLDSTNVRAPSSLGGKITIYQRKKIKDEDIIIEKKNHHERSSFDGIN